MQLSDLHRSRTILTIDHQRLPRLFFFCLGAGLAFLISSLAFHQRSSTLLEQQNQNYGAALARMAAQQAVDAALNHDLVSLQVILQDVAANPGAVLATIHDVENNLLVQAGDAVATRRAEVPLVTHTAPITLHDSIAGYVTVTLAVSGNPMAALTLVTLGLGLLLTLAAGFLLYQHRKDALIWPTAKAPSGPAEPPEANEAEEGTAAGIALVHIRILNLPNLHRQLSADAFQAALAGFEQLLDDVLALYGGEGTEEDEGAVWSLRFESTESQTEAAFRAGCGAWLLHRLSGRLAPCPLQIGALITAGESNQGAADAPASGLWMEHALAGVDPLHNRLLGKVHGGFYQVDGFRQPYGALLERQLQQLAQVHV